MKEFNIKLSFQRGKLAKAGLRTAEKKKYPKKEYLGRGSGVERKSCLQNLT